MKSQTPVAPAGKRTTAPKPARSIKADAALAAGPQPAAPGTAREELIRQRAYSLYLERGCQAGHELEDWLKAEVLVDRSAATTAKAPDH